MKSDYKAMGIISQSGDAEILTFKPLALVRLSPAVELRSNALDGLRSRSAYKVR